MLLNKFHIFETPGDPQKVLLSDFRIEKLIEVLVIKDILPKIILELDERPVVLARADVDGPWEAFDVHLVLHVLAELMGGN